MIEFFKKLDSNKMHDYLMQYMGSVFLLLFGMLMGAWVSAGGWVREVPVGEAIKSHEVSYMFVISAVFYGFFFMLVIFALRVIEVLFEKAVTWIATKYFKHRREQAKTLEQ